MQVKAKSSLPSFLRFNSSTAPQHRCALHCIAAHAWRGTEQGFAEKKSSIKPRPPCEEKSCVFDGAFIGRVYVV